MDEEISAMSNRIAEGIQVSDDTIAADMITKIGPGPAGDKYLTAEHTLEWLRSDEYLLNTDAFIIFRIPQRTATNRCYPTQQFHAIPFGHLPFLNGWVPWRKNAQPPYVPYQNIP